MLLGGSRSGGRSSSALALARSGTSALLALVGEPGIGKTTLLGYAAGQADRMRLLRARGIESGGADPVRLAAGADPARPGLPGQDPAAAGAALEGALALRPGAGQDRFAVGAATLSLLAAFADEQPVAVLIDDAHWLDVPSAQALLFAVRRLVADPIAVIIASARASRHCSTAPTCRPLRLDGLTSDEAAELVADLTPDAARRLHAATAGNPLALLELAAASEPDLALAPDGAPVLVSARISRAFLQQTGGISAGRAGGARAQRRERDRGPADAGTRRARSSGSTSPRSRKPRAPAWWRCGPARWSSGTRWPARPSTRPRPAGQRRDAHRALAAVLPDRDIARRAWHLAAAATGPDETASAALERAALAGRDRSAYATAAAAFERAGRLTVDRERGAVLLLRAAETSWLAGFTDRAVALLAEARAQTATPRPRSKSTRWPATSPSGCGRVMRGHEILVPAAAQADPERAVVMLAEAALACLFAGDPAEMLDTAARPTPGGPPSPRPGPGSWSR